MAAPVVVKEHTALGPVVWEADCADVTSTVGDLAGAGGETSILKRPRICEGYEIARGAEGVISRVTYLGQPAIRKERFPKSYRHPALDKKLTSRRLAQEARVLLRLRRAGILVPAVYSVNSSKGIIVLQDMGGITLKDFLASCGTLAAMDTVCSAGTLVKRMHEADIVHGDLTTSNMLVRSTLSENGVQLIEIALIDFGLSSTSGTDEDKAVDLYVLERAIVAAHPQRATALNVGFFNSYGSSESDTTKDPVLRKLDEVRSRGRKRDMMG